ncbi:hypothetical protein HBH56_195970 [Parastagonospora nodorum]|uniref:Peptidase A1 domain-containing protein n=1 Tax=Phaeosphaeria nodorum (strain SN15 / ATCC MYA-4574 / FGSC 10173) TaxID=321614 RepID=A0A7U2FCM1_PHANO|nr:hypothetical protein HBH56_195970 [Parastagonospora nodorum]QRD00580.1 hypothetical protein JI435_091360 [Parastagonospora nodorum SN15]KAH3924968.1 hypothetical protein HBH54_187520 [Parastagonospora nodorum]KAH3984247.1 hypothetical protein HBH51_029820 [Parastagonospora nodorum]KAH4052025.1 hypothetical protein HBH49_111070 [Parastagonospora nodorum]
MESELHKAGLLPLLQSAQPSNSTALSSVSKSSTLFRRIAVVLLALSFYVIFKSVHVMPSTDTNLSQGSNTTFIPFIHKFSPKHVPQVMCTIEGVEIWMPVDTGSTGLLIGAPILPNIDPKIGEPAHHFFTSSKILYVGRLVKLPVHFHGEAGSATSNIPVLVVDKSWRCPWYSPGKDSFDCPPGPNGEKATQRDTSQITYMGVGFGRNCPRDGMPIAAPRVNPFLNIDTIDGVPIAPHAMQPGYIVTTKGVHLGLTPDNIQGFLFEDLQPGLTHDQDPRDWAMARMCFSVNGEGRSCGAVLVDTGIAQMYIRPDDGMTIPNVTIRNPNKHGYAKMVKRVKRGTQIAVAFPSFTDQAMSYSFTVGEGSSIEPNYVVPARATSAAYVNTGRNLLNGYSIAFDAIGGRFGLRPVHPSSSSVL